MAWARLDDGFGDHPKVLDLIDTLPELEGAAAIGLWTLALAYAHRTMRVAKVPGYIPRSFARRSALVPPRIGDHLVAVGLWEEADGGWLIHDFDDYLPSEELKAKRAEAGRRGAAARWGKTAEPEDEAPATDSNLPSGSHDGDGTSHMASGKKCPEPEPEPEPKKNKDQNISSATAPPPPDTPPQGIREDVERICAHLADRIEGNGSRRPAVTAKWRTAARLMLDADKRTEDEIHGAIDWSQNHEFWRGNVLSLPKLRDKYDQLRLQATRASPTPRPASNTAYLAASMERALAAEAAEDNDPPTLWKALPA